MDQEVQHTYDYLSAAKTGLDVAQKSGLLQRLVSRVFSRHTPVPPHEQQDYRTRALQALQENALETLASLELTTEQTLQILAPGFSLDDLGKVNSTWQNHWAEGASKVGIDDDERRSWWARLLAGEIQGPGTYSLRTLAVMDILSAREAQLFTRVCEYIWNPESPVLILPTEKSELWKPSVSEISILESSGLVKDGGAMDYNWEATRGSGGLLLKFNADAFLLRSSDTKPVRVRFGHLILTVVGIEMYGLTTPNYPKSYLDEIVAEWRESHSVQNVRLT